MNIYGDIMVFVPKLSNITASIGSFTKIVFRQDTL